jgi:serine/threonine protein kinase
LGCTVIELLTGFPPYFSLEPYQALFKIVDDIHPKLPDKISHECKDFLLHCFKKEIHLRKTAEKLLEHPWIKNVKNTKKFNDEYSGSKEIELMDLGESHSIEINIMSDENMEEKELFSKKKMKKNLLNYDEGLRNSLTKIKNHKFDKILDLNGCKYIK